jgi:hypothetical protein
MKLPFRDGAFDLSCVSSASQLGLKLCSYFGLSAGLTNLRPLGPLPLTWITTGSRTSTKWGTLAGSV